MSIDGVISAEGLSKSFSQGDRDIDVLVDVNLKVRRGETVAILGVSGSGKSTLLHVLAGLDEADSGSIYLVGKNLASLTEGELGGLRNRQVGFVYQFHYLLSEFDARENVAMPLLIAGEGRASALEKAEELLVKVNLDKRLDHLPSAMSGGERQRVAIARALVACPDVVFADEPTGNLDEFNSSQIRDLMLSLAEESGTALLVATHSQEFAERMFTVYRLHRGVLETV